MLNEEIKMLEEKLAEAKKEINDVIAEIRAAYKDLNDEVFAELEVKVNNLIKRLSEKEERKDTIEIKSDSLIITDDKILLSLSNATEGFSFAENITLSKGAFYFISDSLTFDVVFEDKKVSLQEGDNVFYLLVTNGEHRKLYTVTLRRRPIYTVYFSTERGALEYNSQKVEEGTLAAPPRLLTPAGYTIDRWDYDFTKPVTENNLIASATIKIGPDYVYPESISLDKTELKLKHIGETQSLVASILPNNVSDIIVNWSTDNSEIATVENGVIKAVGVGTVKISATTINNKTVSCTVTVYDHLNENGDHKCDYCDTYFYYEDDVIAYPWSDDEPVEIIIMMSHADNFGKNPSGCERYIAGGTNDNDVIDRIIDTRNAAAEDIINVHVIYKYYPKEPTKQYERRYVNAVITAMAKSDKKDEIPNIFVNFASDLLACSFNGSFHNLKDNTFLTNGAIEQGNYFEFLADDYNEKENNRGYMLDYMNSTSLSDDKVYILASDYFFDIIRSLYVVPVNISLLESVGMEVTGDLNGDKKFTVDDFYQEVMEKGWTYDKVAAYSSSVHRERGNNLGNDLDDVLGFAISKDYGSAYGMLYSTDIQMLKKYWNQYKGIYEPLYPGTCQKLSDIFDAINGFIGKKGVYLVASSDESMSKYGQTPIEAIRTRFCENKILFGDVVLLGSLEATEYQNLIKNGSGFGVAPVPNYREFAVGEEYKTCIHNAARPGAIGVQAKNFTACTAFLNYISTHSAEVVSVYYANNLQYNYESGKRSTIEMLNYIRSNVGSSFDQNMEDVIEIYTTKPLTSWIYPLYVHNYKYTEIRKFYAENTTERSIVLLDLIYQYENIH